MTRRRFWGYAALLLLAASLPGTLTAEEGYLDVKTSLADNTTAVGYRFDVIVDFHYSGVAGDKIVQVKLTCREEWGNPYSQINKGLMEDYACEDRSRPNCAGVLHAKFPVWFVREVLPESSIQVEGRVRTSDRKYTHLLDTKVIKIKMVPQPEITIEKVDYPQPPDTVTTMEDVPIVVHLRCERLAPENIISIGIKHVAGFGYLKTWEAKPMSGSRLLTSSPMLIRLDYPGTWDLDVHVLSTLSASVHALQKIQIEVEQGYLQEAHITKIDYPKPPETITMGEKAVFAITMRYEHLPPGTKAVACFYDIERGIELFDDWKFSLPLSGEGTYTFPAIALTPTKAGTWKLEARLKVPAINDPNDWRIKDTEEISVQVTSGPPPSEAEVQITEVKRPQGTILVGETAPIVITVTYSKLHATGSILIASVYERESGHHVNYMESELLSGRGTYTFKPIPLMPSRAGEWALRVEIHEKDGGTISSKMFTLQVVER